MRLLKTRPAAKPDDFPPEKLPELAVVGRSNVGKSSLINALVGADLARTSRTPGRSRLVNWFPLFNPEMKAALLTGETRIALNGSSAEHVFADRLARTDAADPLLVERDSVVGPRVAADEHGGEVAPSWLA